MAEGDTPKNTGSSATEKGEQDALPIPNERDTPKAKTERPGIQEPLQTLPRMPLEEYKCMLKEKDVDEILPLAKGTKEYMDTVTNFLGKADKLTEKYGEHISFNLQSPILSCQPSSIISAIPRREASKFFAFILEVCNLIRTSKFLKAHEKLQKELPHDEGGNFPMAFSFLGGLQQQLAYERVRTDQELIRSGRGDAVTRFDVEIPGKYAPHLLSRPQNSYDRSLLRMLGERKSLEGIRSNAMSELRNPELTAQQKDAKGVLEAIERYQTCQRVTERALRELYDRHLMEWQGIGFHIDPSTLEISLRIDAKLLESVKAKKGGALELRNDGSLAMHTAPPDPYTYLFRFNSSIDAYVLTREEGLRDTHES